jgi:endonuclease YncB( thermonuclease family)
MANSTASRFVFLGLAGLIIVSGGIPAAAQTNRTNVSRSRYYTPYMRAYGGTAAAGYGRGTPYGAQYPRVQMTPALPPVSGTVTKYSPVEYGQIVKMAVDAARKNSPISNSQANTVRLVDLATTKTATGETVYAPVSTRVSQVLDRGILLLSTGEELRLRGVFMPSSTDTNDVLRLYAKEGVQKLAQLTGANEVYVLLDEPLRGNSGQLLGTVILADGTELNRRMLELGYGSLKPEDFGPGVDFSDLQKAQATAKEQRLGIWSRM